MNNLALTRNTFDGSCGAVLKLYRANSIEARRGSWLDQQGMFALLVKRLVREPRRAHAALARMSNDLMYLM